MDAVERHLTLPTDLDEAWALLTRPEDLAGWLGAEVVLDPTPGAAGLVVDHDGTRRRLTIDGVDGEGDGVRTLAWRWWVEGEDGRPGVASRVELTLVPVPEGTRLTVTERPEHDTATAGSVGPSSQASVQASAAAGDAWSHRLLHLEALLLLAAAVRG
ncbi:MAG: hypothetical protein JWM47_2149 [Acidimicrobiales bacterium]|nr:hypothetical protein [Acidimicrobiales bacterium]